MISFLQVKGHFVEIDIRPFKLQIYPYNYGGRLMDHEAKLPDRVHKER